MKYGYFLQMGGFKLVYLDKESVSGGFPLLHDQYRYHSRLGDGIWEAVLQFEALMELLQKHKIDFPSTTEAEIDDRSKGDALSKGIALLQITWFIIQLIARRVQGLAITELELTTAALAGLNSGTSHSTSNVRSSSAQRLSRRCWRRFRFWIITGCLKILKFSS